MNKKSYWTNKIQYALQKIDYSKSRLLGREHKNILSTLYFVLQNYQKVDLNTIMNTTKLSREDVSYGLRLLREIGVAGWEGDYLSLEKEIEVKDKVDWKTFVKNLDEKVAKLHGKSPEEKIVKKIEEPVESDGWVNIQLEDDMIIKVTKTKLKKLLLGG